MHFHFVIFEGKKKSFFDFTQAGFEISRHADGEQKVIVLAITVKICMFQTKFTLSPSLQR